MSEQLLKVLYSRPRFRVGKLLSGCYALQAKPLGGETWVTIEIYDYYCNARVRAGAMHEVVDGNWRPVP